MEMKVCGLLLTLASCASIQRVPRAVKESASPKCPSLDYGLKSVRGCGGTDL